jgi:DNA polymerase V
MEDNFSTLTDTDNVSVHSGFPNPAANRLDKALSLDFNQLLVKRPSSTFVFRVTGHAYSDQGIYDGSVIVVDRGLTPRPTSLVVIWQDDSFRLVRYSRLEFKDGAWGVVKATIQTFRED